MVPCRAAAKTTLFMGGSKVHRGLKGGS